MWRWKGLTRKLLLELIALGVLCLLPLLAHGATLEEIQAELDYLKGTKFAELRDYTNTQVNYLNTLIDVLNNQVTTLNAQVAVLQAWIDAYQSPDLSGLATLGDIPDVSGFALIGHGHSEYALASEIPSMPDLSGYALSTHVHPEYENPVIDLSNYAMLSDIPDLTGLYGTVDSHEGRISTLEAVGGSNEDLCPNLEGDQYELPMGYILDGQGNCVPEQAIELDAPIMYQWWWGGNQWITPVKVEDDSTAFNMCLDPDDIPDMNMSQVKMYWSYGFVGVGGYVAHESGDTPLFDGGAVRCINPTSPPNQSNYIEWFQPSPSYWQNNPNYNDLTKVFKVYASDGINTTPTLEIVW